RGVGSLAGRPVGNWAGHGIGRRQAAGMRGRNTIRAAFHAFPRYGHATFELAFQGAGECILCRGAEKQRSVLGGPPMQRWIAALFTVVPTLIVGHGPAAAQDYPSRPIRAVTTTSAGGLSDIFMRASGEELHKKWGQPIIVDNRPGGMQNVGARACQDSTPDGYTICILNADPVVYNQYLLKSLNWDPEKGIQPVTNLYHLIHMLVVNSDLKVKTVEELVALSKARPGTLSYLSPGAPMVAYMEWLNKDKGADWVRVPFKA